MKELVGGYIRTGVAIVSPRARIDGRARIYESATNTLKNNHSGLKYNIRNNGYLYPILRFASK